jgi:hypothetical protein
VGRASGIRHGVEIFDPIMIKRILESSGRENSGRHEAGGDSFAFKVKVKRHLLEFSL